MRHLIVIALVLASAVGLVVSPAPASAADCEFVLGFKALHDLIPATAGDCREDEHHAANGDGLQATTGGLLVWRKHDNWTAFTDGYHTWINGPNGLQERLNVERFAWEKAAATVASTTVIDYAPPPSTATVLSGSCFSSSLASNRADASRCMAGNDIYDPCFASPGNAAAVICVRDPRDASSLVELDLGQPVAVPQFVPAQKQAWFLLLADGTTCGALTGATGAIQGERINYGCSDGWYVLGTPAPGPVWTVREVHLAAQSLQVGESAVADVDAAWK